MGRVLGAHKRKSSCCPGKPQVWRQDTLALFPTLLLTWGEPLSFLELSSSPICKMGGCGAVDSWWAVVARSGGKQRAGEQELAPPGGQVFVRRPSSRRMHPWGWGRSLTRSGGHLDHLPCRGIFSLWPNTRDHHCYWCCRACPAVVSH